MCTYGVQPWWTFAAIAASVTMLANFTYLKDHIPDWLSRLDDLAALATEQHARFIRTARESDLRLTRRKHDSTESLRPAADDGENPIVPSTPWAPPPHPDGTGVLHGRRKRKPGSSWSGASGPQRYRMRSMVVVYYDSVIQDAFELLVRNIASARNQLRKGKTAAGFQRRMASLHAEVNAFPDDVGSLNPKILRPAGSGLDRRGLSGAGVDPCDAADQNLETAQSLCEVAAHQILRDGDCDEEIREIRTRLERCRDVATAEVESLQAKEAPEPLEQAPKLEETSITSDLAVSVSVAETKPATYAAVGAIEVDNDSDASSVHIDLTAFRRTRRA